MTYVVVPASQLRLEQKDIINELEQGAIIRHIPLFAKSPISQENQSITYKAPVFVLSQGCEIDKKINPNLHSDCLIVAAIFKVSALPKENQGNVRKNIILNAFYLPLADPLLEDCFIDWRTIQPVDKQTLITSRSDTSSYLCTIKAPMIDEVQGRFWDFFFRPLPRPTF